MSMSSNETLPPHDTDADEATTRDRVARSILEQGPSTAAELAERLDLTPAAVRRHLAALIESGISHMRGPFLAEPVAEALAGC